MPSTRSLPQDLDVDVCIVGGGIAGMTSAYLLSKEGKRVCVLEDSEIGSGQTGRTTAQLSHVLDRRFSDLEKVHGEVGARMIVTVHSAAMRKIEEIIQREGIDCDLETVDGYLFSGGKIESGFFQKELSASIRAGLLEVQAIRRAPLPHFDTGPCLRYPGQLQMHPLKYLSGMAKALVEDKHHPAQIFTHTHVVDVKSTSDTVTIKTRNGFQVNAKAAVMATHSPESHFAFLS